MIVALRAPSQSHIDGALAWLDNSLVERSGHCIPDAASAAPRTLGRALRAADASIAVISTPGANVVPEAVDALRAGALTMIFSDGVTLHNERRLKELAADVGGLVMGPDCGTALVRGIALGFANKVDKGHIGIVAASGTGAQHLSCLLNAQGLGISHILGVGGRDLLDEIGGLSTLRALSLLDADPTTEHIVVVSKPPGPRTAARIASAAEKLSTAVTLGLLGQDCVDITHLAREVTLVLGRDFIVPRADRQSGGEIERGALAGLFSGGSLATEARCGFGQDFGPIADLDDFGPAPSPTDIARCDGHVLVDLGDSRMTVGRPHPMIDSTIRRDIIAELGASRRCRHLFVDIVLGYAAAPDPVGDLADAISGFLSANRANTATAAIVGTAADPQGLELQRRRLLELGCDVFESNAMATAEVASRLELGQ